MDINEFIKQTEDFCYKEVAKNTNLILGKNKTASLSTGMFLKLPMVIAVEKAHAPLPKLNKELESFMPYFSAYTKHGNTSEVYFTFLYHTDKDLKHISRELVRHGTFLAFVYMHEVQHILRKHITNSYNTMMTSICGDVAFPNELINIAEDHAINYSIKDLFLISPLAKEWPVIEAIGMYDPEYHQNKLSDIEILKDLLKKDHPITKQQVSDMLSQITCDGKTTNQPTEAMSSTESTSEDSKSDKTSTTSDDADMALSDLSESLQDIITSNTKGTAAGELFENLFSSIKVNVAWFSKLKKSFKRKVYYMTHDYTTSWANLNNTYRRIYKSPKKQFMEDSLEIVLSIDHSGSVGTEALQKLLYLMEETSKQITKLTVLIHDTKIVKEFVIEDEYDIANSLKFNTALATRYVVGGTSHSDVFRWLDENVDDMTKTIYLSYSDNYSDINTEWVKYPKFRNLTSYFVCTTNNPTNMKGVTDIVMV